jgi:phage terminase large subunit
VYDEILYEKGLTNGDIAKLVKKDFKRKIVADSSEPKSITEIKGYNVDIVGAVKGADSIKFGIQNLQNEEFLVTARSLNLIDELRKYRWIKSKDGKNINVPIDAYNHCIDPMRYINEQDSLKPKVKRSGGGVYD